MKKYLLCTICTFTIGASSLFAQSTKSQVSKNEIQITSSEKIERPLGESIVVQPILNRESTVKAKKVDVTKKETLLIAEPKKQSNQSDNK